MKNLIRKMLLFMCVAMLTFAFTACGNSDDAEPAAVEEEDAESADEDTAGEDAADAEAEDDASDLSATGKYATLEEFINSDEMKEQMETQTAALEGTGLSVELAADGSKLIYNFTITDSNVAVALDVAALESSLDSQASTYEAIASTIPLAVEVENPSVVVRYLDSTGAELLSKEFVPSAE